MCNAPQMERGVDGANRNPTFVSEPIEPGRGFLDVTAPSRGEPPLPEQFQWRGSPIEVSTVLRTWRSTKTDRGDDYLARFWFEVTTADGRTAVVYFDRKAHRDAPRWWLYTISGDSAD
jgi:Domain of unknown function (DUF6504)